jgi:ferredoxin
VARSAVRSKAVDDDEEDEKPDQRIAYDVARSALRISGDKQIRIVCLEQLQEMPADEIEIIEGSEEGIKLHNGRGPKEILAKKGIVTGLRTIKCKSVFDEKGRFSPVYDETDIEDIPADSILFAIGQTCDLSFLKPEDGVETDRGLIKVNLKTYQTTAPDVFACGDIAHGPKLFINAIASAQIAARSMHDFLRNISTEVVIRKKWQPADYTMLEGWDKFSRCNPPVMEAEERASSVEVIEHVFPEKMALYQASRCLRCNINTVFDTSYCIACRGCVDVCPQNLIHLVSLSNLPKDPKLMDLAKDTLGITKAEIENYSEKELDELGAIMLKDETTCIRCAMCASRCPTHAITMQRFDFYRECVSFPTRNPNIKYEAENVVGRK